MEENNCNSIQKISLLLVYVLVLTYSLVADPKNEMNTNGWIDENGGCGLVCKYCGVFNIVKWYEGKKMDNPFCWRLAKRK